MSREKQIEEMAKLICSSHNNNACVFNHESCDLNCSAKNNAENIYNAGYRKASEVAREIFAEIEKVAFTYYIDKETDKAYRAVELAFIAELKKKYTEREK